MPRDRGGSGGGADGRERHALEKFLAASQMAFPENERQDIVFAVNIETIVACKAFDEMLALPSIGVLGGVVIGRVD